MAVKITRETPKDAPITKIELWDDVLDEPGIKVEGNSLFLYGIGEDSHTANVYDFEAPQQMIDLGRALVELGEQMAAKAPAYRVFRNGCGDLNVWAPGLSEHAGMPFVHNGRVTRDGYDLAFALREMGDEDCVIVEVFGAEARKAYDAVVAALGADASKWGK